MSSIKVSVLPWVPPSVQGLVRELRVRWALEEAGISYDEWPIPRDQQRSEAYLAAQPFGQVPAFQDGDLILFESGAIVLHIAEKSAALLPEDLAARARAVSWMFAALSSVEPNIQLLGVMDSQYGDQGWWTDGNRPVIVGAIQRRLDGVARHLAGRDHLSGDTFTAADLLMTTVFRILRDTDLLSCMPVLETYRLRNEARPAFQRALAAQMALFARNAPPASPA